MDGAPNTRVAVGREEALAHHLLHLHVLNRQGIAERVYVKASVHDVKLPSVALGRPASPLLLAALSIQNRRHMRVPCT